MGDRGTIERTVLSLAVAVLAPGIVTGIGLAASLEDHGGLTALYVLAVGLAAWVGGLYAGLLATVLSYVPLDYFFVGSRHTFAPVSATSVLAIAAFVITAVGVTYLLARLQRARHEAVDALDEQRRLTDVLAESRRRLVSILEETRTGSWEWDVRANAVMWSENMAEVHGMPSSNPPRDYASWLQLVHPDDRDRVDRVIQEVLDRGDGYELELRLATAGGETRWIWTRASVLRDGLGRPLRLVGLTRDVTERKRAGERAELLARATELLSGTLEYESALAKLARLLAPRLADACRIDLRRDDGELETVAVAPGGRELADQAAAAAVHVARSGQPARSESRLVVPLRSASRIVGVLTLARREGSGRRLGDEELALAEELAGRVGVLVDNAQLHRAEQRARAEAERIAAQMARFQRLIGHLSAAATARQAAEILVQEGSESLGAIAGWVSVVSSDGAELRHVASFGYANAFVEAHSVIPADSPHVAAQVFRAGEPLWLETTIDAQQQELVDAYEATGAESLVLVPLEASDRRLGFFALRFRGPRTFPEEERLRLLTVTGQCAQALDRALVYERERVARRRAQRASERLVRVQAMTAALAKAMTVQEVAEIIVEQGSAAFDAEGAAVHLIDEDGTGLRLSADFGHPPELVEHVHHLPLDAPWIGADALERRKILWFESNRDLARRWPEQATQRQGWEAIAVIPLVGGAGPLGLLVLNFLERRRQSLEDRSLLATLVRQCGQALERAQLYEQERQVRIWLRRLQAITERLSAATEVEEVAEVVIDQALTALGARTGVLGLLSGGELVVQRTQGYDPSAELPARIPLDSPMPLAESAQSRTLVVRRSLDERLQRDPLTDGTDGPVLAGTLVGLPLLTGSEVLGALGFSLDEPRDLGEEERQFLTALARQAVQALERARLYEGEQRARLAAQRANERLRALEAVAQVGLASQTLDELLDSLLPLVRDLFGADRAALFLAHEEQPEIVLRAAVGVDQDLRGKLKIALGEGIAGRIAASGLPMLVDDVSTASPRSAYLRERGGSLLGVPLRVEGRVIGVLNVSSDAKAAFAERDLRILTLAAERIALALERISLYEREHDTAVTLQRSVLPEAMPEVEGVGLAARYVPGSTGVEVGGDWYDALDLGHGRVGFAVGDVVGKGVLAAATMTQLRNALRVYALEGLKPSSVLARLNRLVESTGPSFATVLYGVVDTATCTVRLASAGHPPPLVVRDTDGAATFLEGGRSVPLGVRTDAEYRQETIRLEPGDTLLLYTDGLVERRGRSLEERLEQLSRSAAAGPAEPEVVVERVVHDLLQDDASTDDVAVLAVCAVPHRVGGAPLRLSFPAEPVMLAPLRERLREWLAAQSVGGAARDEIVLACSEACANAIEHASEEGTGEFEVVAERSSGDVVVRVRDHGRWREPQPSDVRGLGLRLIEELMDGLEIVRSEDGTEVRLRRRVESAQPVPA